jgi:hypothetical protein
LDNFIENFSHMYHVTHHPSLPATVDELYRQVENQEPVKASRLLLLLSIIASATLIWTPRDNENRLLLFPSPVDAAAQTPKWVKSAFDVLHAGVLNAGRDGSHLVLEAVQGVIILSFLLCNLEGVSLRYRFLLSTGFLLSRELGLHRIDDHGNDPTDRDLLSSEMGRRAWWYLVATNW